MCFDGTRIGSGLGRGARLADENHAQVSFAVIAVVILVASGMTGAYLGKKELDQMRDKKDKEILDAMEAAIQAVERELGICAASKAYSLVSSWSEFPLNESRISDEFEADMLSYVSDSFPRMDGGFTIEVGNLTSGLCFVEKRTMDLVPSDNVTQTTLDLNGSSMQYDRIPAACVDVLAETTADPYYVAVGNFTVRVFEKKVSFSREGSFERPVISALPLIESKLRAFETASDGEYNDIGKLVEYMLVTLCQLRVLDGYGRPLYSGGLDTADILTEEDAYRAVAVALLIEQAKLFRAVDDEFAREVMTLCDSAAPGIVALLGSSGRCLDPAELFLWFIGRTDARINATMILAQSIYGIADQMAVKLMEYLGWLGAADFAQDYAGFLADSLQSIVSFFTGEDKAKEAVTSWISKCVSSTGEDAEAYCVFYSSLVDFFLRIPERKYFVQNASGDLFPVWVGNVTAPVDVPAFNVLSSDLWADLYPAYKDCQRGFQSQLSDVVARLAFDIAGCARLDGKPIVVDPTDGEDLFTSLSMNSGRVSIVIDESSLSRIGKNFPLFTSQYLLAREFGAFVEERGASLMASSVGDGVMADIASTLAVSARYAYIPDLVVPVEQQLSPILLDDVRSDDSWGVGEAAESSLLEGFRLRLMSLVNTVNQSVTSADDGFAGPLVDSVARFVLIGCGGFPGLRNVLEDGLEQFSRAIIAQRDLSGHLSSVYVDLENPFEFWDGERSTAEERGCLQTESLGVTVPDGLPPLQIVPFDPEAGYSTMRNMFPTGNILVQVQRPWDFEGSTSEYPNMHLTSLTNCSATPYATQWVVSVVGLVEIDASVADSGIQATISGDAEAVSNRTIRMNFSIPVVVHSSWALNGVQYSPTNTFLKDSLDVARRFLQFVWEKIEPYVGWIKDGLERIFRFLQDAFDAFTSFATRVVKVLSQAMQTIVETLQEYVQKIANSVLAKAVKAFIDLTGRVEVRVSMHGFLVIIQTNLPDLLYRHGTDMLRVIFCTDRLGPSMSFGIRVARFSDGSYDILANGTVVLSRAKIEVLVDPLMKVLRRLVEVHCTGKAWAMDLLIPEVEPYSRARVSTADIPGIGAMLSNIPLPTLGLTASVEAGLNLKFSPPFPSDVVVNEFESNPAGSDSGKEWVELYNPLGTAKCVDGWMIATMHGKNEALSIHGTIAPNGIATFYFPETSIDNGDDDDPFTDGDSIILLDAAGVPVDVTPVMRDTGNDARTNQRNWDGGPRWVFEAGSPGGSNGVPILLATSDFIVKALFEAFKEAFVETQLQEVTASLDFLVTFCKRVLGHFIDNLLSIISEIIQSVTFFLEVTLNDASASIGAGVRFSFIITGHAIESIVRWIVQTLATIIVNLGRASHPAAVPPFPKDFFSGLYLSFQAIFFVGMPKMIRALGAVGNLHQRFTLAISVSPNIPAIGKLMGKDWGTWEVSFGACLEQVPRTFAAGFLTNDRMGDYIDYWLLKGRLYGR